MAYIAVPLHFHSECEQISVCICVCVCGVRIPQLKFQFGRRNFMVTIGKVFMGISEEFFFKETNVFYVIV